MGFHKLTSQQIRVQICRYFFVRNKQKKKERFYLSDISLPKKISLLTKKRNSGEAHAKKKDIAIYFKKTKTSETETEKKNNDMVFFRGLY